ncbi:hypothetical protein [Mastigocladopsis repens]|nr:hypothetical protein [Mastigocladopsis repens]
MNKLCFGDFTVAEYIRQESEAEPPDAPPPVRSKIGSVSGF